MIWDYLQVQAVSAEVLAAVPTSRSELETGFALERRRSAAVFHEVKATYLVGASEWCALVDFYKANRGKWFDWTMPGMAGVYPARFLDDLRAVDYVDGPSPMKRVLVRLEVFAPEVACILGEGGQVGPSGDPLVFTDFYIAKDTAAPVSPAYGSGWNNTSYAIRRKLLRNPVPDGDGLVEATFGHGNWPGSNQKWLLVQAVSDPLKAQTISGNVRGQVQAVDLVGFTGGVVGQVFVAVSLRVVSGDGLTVRGTLYSLAAGATAIAAAYTNRYAPTQTAVTSVAAQDGDRLVLELGIARSSASVEPLVGTGGQYLKVRHGSKVGGLTQQLPVDETDTSSTKVPWLRLGSGVILDV